MNLPMDDVKDFAMSPGECTLSSEVSCLRYTSHFVAGVRGVISVACSGFVPSVLASSYSTVPSSHASDSWGDVESYWHRIINSSCGRGDVASSRSSSVSSWSAKFNRAGFEPANGAERKAAAPSQTKPGSQGDENGRP